MDTELDRLPCAEVASHVFGIDSSRGILISGETGKGKTRLAWLLVRERIQKGVWPVKVFDCVSFGHELSKEYRNENAENWLDDVGNAALVFFDDLGKLKLTERAEAELFGVIERRCANQLPIIATTNDTGDTLASRMTDNRGPALIRRLREFCEIVRV